MSRDFMDLYPRPKHAIPMMLVLSLYFLRIAHNISTTQSG